MKIQVSFVFNKFLSEIAQIKNLLHKVLVIFINWNNKIQWASYSNKEVDIGSNYMYKYMYFIEKDYSYTVMLK